MHANACAGPLGPLGPLWPVWHVRALRVNISVTNIHVSINTNIITCNNITTNIISVTNNIAYYS